jgi:structural maintenance of chromosome 3 (chondroitin sulfate proteoglycan 6)
LKMYQQLDKQRRSLEYTIFEKELLDARQKLEEVVQPAIFSTCLG